MSEKLYTKAQIFEIMVRWQDSGRPIASIVDEFTPAPTDNGVREAVEKIRQNKEGLTHLRADWVDIYEVFDFILATLTKEKS